MTVTIVQSAFGTGSRPSLIINVAMTVDGKTDTFARHGAAISSAGDMARVDQLRAECDAIMVGGHTLLGDDPRLTVKSAARRAERVARGLPENPTKVGIVTKAALRPDSRFLTTGPARRMIFTTKRTAEAQLAMLRAAGAEVYLTEGVPVDLTEVLRVLAGAGVRHLLIEGGGTLNAALLALGVVDEVRVYIAPMIVGGSHAPTLAAGAGLARDEAVALTLESVERDADGGVTLRYFVESKQ
ncbi:MAG TPA: dihydrofolate reductase family protein [Ktedonobacterales bacterium]